MQLFPSKSSMQFIFIGITFSNYDAYDDENIVKSKHQSHCCPCPPKGYLENITVSSIIRTGSTVNKDHSGGAFWPTPPVICSD